MLIYIILLIIPLVLHYVFLRKENFKLQKILFWILCLIFTVTSCIRYGVGTDYLPIYNSFFLSIKMGIYEHYELLFSLLNRFVAMINGNIVVLMTICAIFTIPIFFRFIKNNVDEKYWFYAVFLFIGTTIYYATMNLVRQYMAIAIILYAFEDLKKGHYIKFTLFNLIAMLFHTSAIFNIVLLILYYLWKHKYTKYIFYGIYILSLILIFIDARNVIQFFSFLIPSRYLGYLDSVFFHERNWLAVLKIIYPNILLILYYKTVYQKNKEDRKVNFILLAHFVFVALSNAFYGINIFIRLGVYFDYYMILIIPSILCYFEEQIQNSANKRKYQFFYYTMLLFTIAYCFVWNVYSIFMKNGHGVIPYKTFFGKYI